VVIADMSSSRQLGVVTISGKFTILPNRTRPAAFGMSEC
jgi:hypothetical protein